VSDLQHPDSRSFELVADVYERARPGYPDEAVAWVADRLDLRPGRTVLDVGAGTGKLSRQLMGTGAEVIAVEPGNAMRAELVRAVPGVQALRGSAEDLPLADCSADAVAVGQAFHWFRPDEAVPEIHRVLRKGGAIALVWNARDEDAPLQKDLDEFFSRFWVPGRRAGGSSQALLESDVFGPLEERRFPFTQELDADGLAERVKSISFVASASPEAQTEIEAELRAVVKQAGDRVEFPYVTVAYVSFAV
jgi:SAM-dependent methyltransferase